MLASGGLWAQCSQGTLISAVSPTAVFQTVNVPAGAPSLNDPTYFEFTGTAGTQYTFSYCQGGGSAGYDTYLTITNAVGTAQLWNDDFCGLSSEVAFTPTLTGTYRVYTSACCPCGTRGAAATLAYRALASGGGGNDNCSGAIALTCGTPVAGSTTGSTVDTYPTCGSATGGHPGVWYSIVGDGGQYTASLCGSSYDTQLSVFGGTCAGLVCISDNDDDCGLQSQVTWSTTPATPYLIFVHGYAGTTGAFTLQVTCAAPCAPAITNDDCAGAEPIPVNTTGCALTVSGNNNCAAPLAPNPNCFSPFATLPDVWYSFTPTTNELSLTVTYGTATSLGAVVYNGTCGTLTQVSCNSFLTSGSGSVISGLTPGQPHFLRILGPQGSRGSFTACLSLVVPGCATYTTPAQGGSAEATGTNLAWNPATYASGYRLYFGTDGGGVTLPTSIASNVDLGNVLSYATGALAPNTTYYWAIVPYNAAGEASGCTIRSFNTNPPACVAAPTAPADGGSGCGGGAILLSWPASPGATGYTVVLNGNTVAANQPGTSYDAGILAAGPYTWSVTPSNGNGPATGCPTWSFTVINAPPGDNLALAIPLDLAPNGSTAVAGNNLASNCYTNQIGNASPDTWYRFNSGACATTVSLDLCTGQSFDSYLRLYDASGTVQLAFSDDVCGAGASIQNFAISPNTDYIVVAEGFGGSTGNFTLTLSVNCYCENPAGAVTAVNEDCGNGTYTLGVNVTGTGSTPTATVRYTVNNGTPVSITGLGVGPLTIPASGSFQQGDAVDVELLTDNGNCVLDLGSYTDNCPIQITCGVTEAISYCYKNNDVKTFTFLASNPNETVTVSFIEGSMDPNDVIRAYSGTDNNGAPIPELTGSFASLFGVGGSSAGDALYIEIDSDGSTSCADGQEDTWVFEAECTAGCVDPDGTVTVNAGCSTIDVEVSFEGDGSSVTLSYSVNGGTPTEIPGLVSGNVETIGPFTPGQSVQVFLLHESDNACNRNLGTYVIPAQPVAVNFGLTATPPTVCPGGSSQLQASFGNPTNITLYSYFTETGATLDPMAGATSLGVAGDDSESGLNAIGFPFFYEGTSYTDFSANSNGVMRFGGPVGAAYFNTGAPFQPASLCVLWDDHSATSVTTLLTGAAPNRVRIISYNLNISFGTASVLQIWLYETTNVIEFRYGSAASTNSATIAAVGANTAQYLSVQNFTGHAVSSSVRQDNLAGWPGSGRLYRFTPPPSVTALDYSWSPADFLTSTTTANPQANGVTASTTYTVTVTGSNGCTYVNTVSVNVATPIESVAITPAVASICAGNPVTLTATPTGGLAPFSYAWTAPGGAPAGGSANQSAGTAGDWSVTVTDACSTSAGATRSVSVNPVPSASISLSAPVCVGGSFTLTCNSDIGTSFAWSGPAPVGGSTGQSVTVNGLTSANAGTYTVTASANGCTSAVASQNVTVNPNPAIAAVTALPAAICEGASSQLNVTATAGTDLFGVLSAFNAGSASVVAAVPTPSGFQMDQGVNSNNISDGCGDMYDGGNRLNTNLGATLQYSDNVVVNSAALGAGGRYFTRYIASPGCQAGPAALFLWAGDINGLSSLSITGNLGADGSGSQQLSTFTVSANGTTYTVLLKRVFNAFDPSVNQMFILPQPNSATQSMGASTDDNLHTITGLAGVSRFYYLLYAGASGALINDAQATGIAQAFVNLLPAGTLAYQWSNGATAASTTVTSPDAYSVLVSNTVTGCSSTGNVTVSQDLTDTDNDGIIDCEDSCPALAGEIGSPCDDFNAGTINDQINGDCECEGTPCSHDLTLAVQMDGVSTVTYELRDQGNDALVQTGQLYLPGPGEITGSACLPTGCFYLRVLDDGGDGIVNGGYVLRMAGASTKRVIDNRNNFTSGAVSQIAGNEGFCLPLGTDRLVFTSCDKLDWKTSPCGAEYVVATENALVSQQYGVNNATSGYQMWWYDPNGGYSFKRFQSHSTSNGLPASATRSCHFLINSWSGNQLQQGVLYNVKVRGRVNGDYLPWGNACRFSVNNALSQCPRTKLMDIPDNPFLSCDQSRPVGTSQASLVHAKPARRMNSNCNWVGANRYQFRFRIPAENFVLVKTSATGAGNYFVNTNGLQCGKTYEVDVRVSFNGGSTWCVASANPNSVDDPAWGDVCTITTVCGNSLAEQGTSATATAGTLRMYPNPNRGDQLMLGLSEVAEGVQTVSVDIYDAFGKRVAARTIPVQDGFVNTVLELDGALANGLYMVGITAGADSYTERLVIQK